MNDELVEKLESFLESINEDNYEDATIELYEQDVIEILKWKNTAKEIIEMLKYENGKLKEILEYEKED